MAPKLPSSTIRNFGGGWNVSDSDLNLQSQFQPVSDNVDRGIDGSMAVRQGNALVGDYADGVTTDLGNISVTFTTTNTSPKVKLTFGSAHGLVAGNHVTVSGLVADINGIPFAELNGTFSIQADTGTTLYIYVRVNATSASGVARTVHVVKDTNKLGGNIIHDAYFNRRLLVFTDIGEVGTMDDSNNLARIWGTAESIALVGSPVPTRRCEHWSSDNFKSTVIACNGYNRDKPLQIKADFTVEFLVDKATSSNAAVPRADYVVCLQGYVIFIRTEYGAPFVEMSAKGTDGTFTRDPSPADSVEVDLSMVTSSVEPTLLGAAPIRDKLYTAFYDKGMIGTLGIYSGTDHQPDFKDTIAENGTISHRTMVPLGNDVFMCDYAGVPSVSISQMSGVYIPVRLSEFIAPAIQQHLSSLSEDTLRSKAFAFYNRANKTYMLFLPIYDPTTFTLTTDPFLFNDELRALNQAIVIEPQHRLFENSNVTIAGATDIGTLTAANINGVRQVVSIIDPDSFIIQLGGHPGSPDDTGGGGSSVTITRINDETIGYVFEYNKEFKIRRWTRYRGWNFDCGCSSQRGKVFLCKGMKVYRMGDNEVVRYADFIGDYDYRAWTNSTGYLLNDRVRDSVTGDVYVLTLSSYTTPATGTFAANRTANPDLWTLYEGEAINWAIETPWSDMRNRDRNKIIKYVGLDTEGTGRFTLMSFVNKIRRDPSTNAIKSYRSIDFQAGDTGGWGIQNPGNYGSGRRTRDEKIWPMETRGKLIRWRWEGSTKEKVKITSLTMYYKMGSIR